MQHNRRDGDLLFYCGRAAERGTIGWGPSSGETIGKTVGMKRGHQRKTVAEMYSKSGLLLLPLSHSRFLPAPPNTKRKGERKGESFPRLCHHWPWESHGHSHPPCFTIPQMQERKTLILLEELPFSQAKHVPSHPCHSGNRNVDAHEKQVNTWSTGEESAFGFQACDWREKI